jgi:hypothetical protein
MPLSPCQAFEADAVKAYNAYQDAVKAVQSAESGYAAAIGAAAVADSLLIAASAKIAVAESATVSGDARLLGIAIDLLEGFAVAAAVGAHYAVDTAELALQSASIADDLATDEMTSSMDEWCACERRVAEGAAAGAPSPGSAAGDPEAALQQAQDDLAEMQHAMEVAEDVISLAENELESFDEVFEQATDEPQPSGGFEFTEEDLADLVE